MRLLDLQRHPLTESRRALSSILSNIYLLDEEGNKHSFAYGDYDYVTEHGDLISNSLKKEDRVIWMSRYFLKLLLMELKWLVGDEEREDGSRADKLLGSKAIWPPEMEKKLRKLDWISLDEFPSRTIQWNEDELEHAGYPARVARTLSRGAKKREVQKQMKEFMQQLTRDPDAQRQMIDHVTASSIKEMVEKIKHYMGIGEVYADREPNNPVLAYQFGKQPFSKAVRELGRLAAPLQRKYKSTDVEEGETIVELPGGWKWVMLSEAFCRKEGAAMNHCGNAGGRNAQERVLSLREPAEGGYWRPHLTFIWNRATQDLGEMKGKNNSKPSRKYHDSIIALLRQDMIGTVVGGGYRPQNNFYLSDLTPQQQLALYVEKPHLFEGEGLSPELQAMIPQQRKYPPFQKGA